MSPPPNPVRLLPALALSFAGMLIVLWAVYSPAFDAPFYFDTPVHLVDHTNLQLVSLTPEALWDAMHWNFGGRLDRPVSRLSLALTHYLFGLSPRAYRVGNLLVHGFGAATLFFLLLSVLRTPRVRRTNPALSRAALPIAAAATLLWALHPVHTNTVTYVIQRMTSLSAGFTFLCVGAYLRARLEPGRGRLAWSVVAFGALVLAAGSKETGLLAFPLALLAELLLLDRPAGFPTRKLALGIMGAGILGLAALLVVGPGFMTYRHRSFDMLERLWTEARLQVDYLTVLLAPHPDNLRFVYEPEISRGWLSPPATLFAVLGVIGAIVWALGQGLKRPLVSFCVLWFFLAQALEATILPLELYYEHRMVVPSAALALGVSAALWWTLGRLPARPAWACALAVTSLLTVGEAWATLQRNRTWADPIAFWSDALEKQPESARIYSFLGSQYTRRERYDEAEEAYRRALELQPAKSHIYDLGLARVLYATGRREEAREHLLRSWNDLQRTNGEAARQLGMLALQDRELDEAQHYLSRALEVNPNDGEAWRLLGVARLLAKDPGGAEEAIRRALRYRPRDAESWNTLGALAFQQEQYGEAEECFREAARLAPDNASYAENLARAARARALP